MKQNNVNISIIPDKRRVKEDETFPLKLRLTFRGVRKYYATGCDANLHDWQLIQEDKVRGKSKKKALYQLQLPVSRIRQYASADKRGTNVLGLLEAADKLGFEAKGAKGPIESLSKIPLPAIAHVIVKEQLHHFVVIYKVSAK